MRRAEEVALRVKDQVTKRIGPVGAIEGGEGGGGTAAGGQLPDRAQVVGPASARRAEEVALRVEDHVGKRLGPVGAVERGQRGERAAAGGQLPDRALIEGPAEGRRAEEVALRVAGQADCRIGPIGAVERGQGTDDPRAGGDLEDRAQVVGPAAARRAEEVALRVDGPRWLTERSRWRR